MNLDSIKNDQSQQEIEDTLILGSIVGLVCLLVILGMIIICLKMKKSKEGGKDTMVNGIQFCTLSYDYDYKFNIHSLCIFICFAIFFHSAVSCGREVVNQPSKSETHENEETANKYFQNPYYGVESDLSSVVDLENTQRIVAKQNPYYE